MTGTIQFRTLLCLVFTLAAVNYAGSDSVRITVYLTNKAKFAEIKDKFQEAIATEVQGYCASAPKKCPTGAKNATTEITDEKNVKAHLNLTVTIKFANGKELSSTATEEMFKKQRETSSIKKATGQQIMAVNEKFYGIEPDNPLNWIMLSIFVVFTIVLLLVVLYLSKHKVNHVEEHYDQMKDKDSSANGEVAA